MEGMGNVRIYLYSKSFAQHKQWSMPPDTRTQSTEQNTLLVAIGSYESTSGL